MADTNISRTLGTPTSDTTWTFSVWMKNPFGGAFTLLNGKVSGSNEQLIQFKSDGSFYCYLYAGGASFPSHKISTAVFNDPAAWYHVHFIWDTTNGTAEDRQRMYINGTRLTDFTGNNNNPSADQASTINTACVHRIGSYESGDYFKGSMSHCYLIDGLALEPTVFGETDSTSGIWKIKTSPTIASYGNNGWCLKMEDRTNLDLDTSSNANTFTTNGTGLTATYDNPSNNFCTMNPLDNYFPAATFSEGNCKIVTNSSNSAGPTGTMGVSAGKWYWEVENDAGSYSFIGIANGPESASNKELGSGAYEWGKYADDTYYRNNNSSTTYGVTYGAGDIIQIALDLDNNKLYFGKDNIWMNSGDPTSGATGTGAISITDPASTTSGFYFAGCGDWSGTSTFKFNFGNGYFGTTAVSSTNADDAGIGSFEYDVPTGYYALCTKNIKAYGG